MSEDAEGVLPWPLLTIDFEASSLAPGSYPIEIGVARWQSSGRPIEGWSTLIRPVPLWRETGSWTAEAQGIHGIPRKDLENGIDPAELLSILNRVIGSHAAFCDGGRSDFGWARRLVLAAGVMNTFRLGDFNMLIGRCNGEGQARVVEWFRNNPAPHRASGDAERLLRGLAHGLGLAPDIKPLCLGKAQHQQA